MLIFLQELVLQLFLWLLQLIDGIMEIFSAISGVATVTYHGEQVNLIDGRSDILVYFHSCGRAFVYLCDSRACQEHGGEQPHGIGRGGEVLSFLARYNGDARRCGARNPYRKFRIATHCEYLSDLEHDKIIDGIVRCLRRGLDQRLFRSGV